VAPTADSEVAPAPAEAEIRPGRENCGSCLSPPRCAGEAEGWQSCREGSPAASCTGRVAPLSRRTLRSAALRSELSALGTWSSSPTAAEEQVSGLQPAGSAPRQHGSSARQRSTGRDFHTAVTTPKRSGSLGNLIGFRSPVTTQRSSAGRAPAAAKPSRPGAGRGLTW